jgi:hypothetical protein
MGQINALSHAARHYYTISPRFYQAAASVPGFKKNARGAAAGTAPVFSSGNKKHHDINEVQ